ncbi:chromate transporter [Pontibacillus salicampi]|uniref:Chromate transporter n=1 Tax=Pontibacillus salicampi TaxID=1449801 RepID=A0ABV6LUD3_9BACI
MATKPSQAKRVSATHKDLLTLFLVFAKISPLTFGGGIAIIPHLESEFVRKKGWFKTEDIPTMLAIAQSAPGSIAVNVAIYIGYISKGIWGSLAALVGMVLPASLIMTMLTYLYVTYNNLSIVQQAFKGIRPAIIGLIIYAAFQIGRNAIQDKLTVIIFIISLGLLFSQSIFPLIMIAAGGGIGMLYPYISSQKGI